MTIPFEVTICGVSASWILFGVFFHGVGFLLTFLGAACYDNKERILGFFLILVGCLLAIVGFWNIYRWPSISFLTQ